MKRRTTYGVLSDVASNVYKAIMVADEAYERGMAAIKPKPRRRAKPFARWSLLKNDGAFCYRHGDKWAEVHVVCGAGAAEIIVRALNRSRVVLPKRGRK